MKCQKEFYWCLKEMSGDLLSCKVGTSTIHDVFTYDIYIHITLTLLEGYTKFRLCCSAGTLARRPMLEHYTSRSGPPGWGRIKCFTFFDMGEIFRLFWRERDFVAVSFYTWLSLTSCYCWLVSADLDKCWPFWYNILLIWCWWKNHNELSHVALKTRS